MSNDPDNPTSGKPPPRDTRFPPGRSGDPRGHPTGTRNRKSILEEVLFSTIVVRQGGRKKRVRAIDLIHEVLINKANHGDRRAQRAVLKWSEYSGALLRHGPAPRRLTGTVTLSQYKAATGMNPDSQEFQDWYLERNRRRPRPGSGGTT